MEKRKPGIPLIAMIIFFALIIGIIITCIIILSSQSGNGSNENIKLSSNTSTDSTNNDNSVMNNAIVKEENNDGEEIDLTDSDVEAVFNLTGNQQTFVKYAIYQSGEFDESSISNKLKLKLAVSQVEDSEIDKSGDTKTISKNNINKHIEEIFGNSDNIDYIDFDLFDDNNFSDYYRIDNYVYNEDEEIYEIIESNITENEPPLVNEMITKAVKYNDRLELYVIPLFIKTFSIDDENNMGYQLYASYDFSNKEYKDELFTVDDAIFAITSQTYKEAVLSNNTVDGYNYDNMKSSTKDFENLQKYKYTFTKNEDTGKYYLTSFEKAQDEEINNNNENQDNE